MFFGFFIQMTAGSQAKRSDEELMLAYQKGDVSGFRLLLERHEAPIFRFCLRSMGNRDNATDATQEIFLRVVKNVDRWEKKAKFTTWLYTIARNYCIDQQRKGRKRKEYSLNKKIDADGSAEHQDMLKDTKPDAERVIKGRKIREVVDNTVDSLPQDQRDVFRLRQYGGLSFKEIAAAVDAGENTVKSRMRYALNALKDALDKAGIKGDLSS